MTVRAIVYNLSTDEELAILAPTREDAVRAANSTYPKGVGFGSHRPTAPGMTHFGFSVDEARAAELAADPSLVVEYGKASIACGDWATLNAEAEEKIATGKQRLGIAYK